MEQKIDGMEQKIDGMRGEIVALLTKGQGGKKRSNVEEVIGRDWI